MNVKKFCKIYVGIGMVYAGFLFAMVRKNYKEEYDHCSIESKVSTFAKVVLTWPKYAARIVKAFKDGVIVGYKIGKDLKESTNESDT